LDRRSPKLVRPRSPFGIALIVAALALAAGCGWAWLPGYAANMVRISGSAHVLDGDTLIISGHHVRLIGLHAPEGRQVCQRGGTLWRCGDEARAALRGLVEGRGVQCEVFGRDRHERALTVCTAGGIDIGRELVRRGLAMAYYPAKGVRGPSYDGDEADAEAAQRGLWGGSFIRPGEWRKGER
jgi:endonuclease YncB( thermonuclease family)